MKKYLKSGLALCIALIMVCSAASVITRTDVLASSGIEGYYFEEDFAEGNLDNWDAPHESDSYKISASQGSNMLTFDYKNSVQGAQYLLVPKSSKVSQSSIEEFNFTAKFSKTPSSLYGGLEIVYDFTDNNNYKFVSVGEFSGKIFRRCWTVKDGKVSVDSSVTPSDTSLGNIDIDFTDFVNVFVSYNSGKATISVEQNSNIKTMSFKTSSTPAMLCNYRQNGNESSTMYIKNAKFYFGGYTDYLAKQYTDKYKTVLNKTLSQVASADEALINEALSDYSKLSSYYQSEYYRYTVVLNNFKEKINALKAGTPFDSNSPLQPANWEYIKGNFSASSFNIGSDGVMTLNSGLMLRLNSSSYLQEETSIKKFTYDVEYSLGNNGGKGIIFVYDFKDSQNYKYNTIWYDKAHKAFFNQFFTCTDGNEISTGTGYANELGSIEGKLQIEIDLSQNGKYIYKLSNPSKGTSFSYSAASEYDGLVLYAKSDIKINNIRAYVYDESDFNSYEKEIKLFKKNYSELIHLTKENVRKNALMKADIEKAIADYENNLSSYSKMTLKSEYKLLKDLLSGIEALSGAYETELPQYVTENGRQTYTFTDDFENGLRKWSNSGSDEKRVVTPSSAIEQKDLNHYVTVSKNGFIYPSSYSIPKKAQLNEVNFKIKLKSSGDASKDNFSAAQPLTIMLSYVDEENWQVLEIYNWERDENGRISYRFSNYVDGVYSAGYHNGSKSKVSDYISDFIDVKLKYSADGRQVTAEITDGVNTDSYGLSLNAVYGNFGLWGKNNYTWEYDDVSIKYVQGSWEENENIDSVYPYYTGNTEYGPDDVLTLYGENIYDNVSRVEFVQISDADYRSELYNGVSDSSVNNTVAKFLPEIAYSHDYQKSGTYIKAASTASFDSTRAVKLKIIQPSKNSFKVIIPKKDALGQSITRGVYALKLCGNDVSGSKDVILYVNNPEIDFVYADEGDHATAGGEVRIIGENLALGYDEIDPNDFIKDSEAELEAYEKAIESNKYKVYVKIQGNGFNKTFSTVDKSVTVQSMNSLKVKLPNSIPKGKYEVSVYSGYGDNTCWSATETLKVGSDIRSSWPDKVYDITNYGADAKNSDQDITGILMDVIQLALNETNGGIIRIPTGRYKLIYSIVIPEKIQLIGDGSDKTILYFDPTQWQMSACPEFLIGFERNIAIEGIGFYGTRGQCIMRSYGGKNSQTSTTYNENIYLKDVNIQFMPILGVVTGGSGVGYVENTTSAELAIRAESTATGSYGVFIQNPYNVQMDNVKVYRTVTNCPLIFNWGQYVRISNSFISDEWQHGNINNSILEYTEFARTTLGFQGENVYYHGNTIYDRTINNRELFVADGSPASHSGNADAVLTLASDEECAEFGFTKDVTFKVISGWGEQHDRVQLYVRNGQGIGQTRMMQSYVTKTIADGTKAYFVIVNEPFTVAPNSNSKIVARTPRENMYFEYMYYENGLATGYFGGFADTVYNKCHWKQVTDIYFDSYNSDLNWYLSMVNGTFERAFNFHDIGTSQWKTDYGSIIFTSQNANAYSPTTGIRFYGNELNGYQLYIKSAYSEGIRDVVIQANNWDESQVAITTLGSATASDGIFIYKNILNDNETYISNILSGRNTVGSQRLMHYVAGELGGFAIGDINGDGEISLKDVTLLKYYLSGELALGVEQINRADFYSDGKVDLADALAIRYFCMTGNLLDPDSTKDDYYDDIL